MRATHKTWFALDGPVKLAYPSTANRKAALSPNYRTRRSTFNVDWLSPRRLFSFLEGKRSFTGPQPSGLGALQPHVANTLDGFHMIFSGEYSNRRGTRNLRGLPNHRYFLNGFAERLRSRSLPSLPEAVKADATLRPELLRSSPQRFEQNLPKRINRHPLKSNGHKEPMPSNDCDTRLKMTGRRELHKVLQQARLPHRLFESWLCLKDQHRHTPESILDAHMERIAHFNSEENSHQRLSNFECGETEEEEEEGCRGYILLEETEPVMGNYSPPQNLPSRGCPSGSPKTQKIHPVSRNQSFEVGFNPPPKVGDAEHSSDPRSSTPIKGSDFLDLPPTSDAFMLS
ncbi:hypothetical protein SprV_0301162800 [Sparganum proliferum]